MAERYSNRHPYNTITALRAAVVYALANIPNTHLIIPYSRFRQRAEAVIALDGGFIE